MPRAGTLTEFDRTATERNYWRDYALRLEQGIRDHRTRMEADEFSDGDRPLWRLIPDAQPMTKAQKLASLRVTDEASRASMATLNV